MIKFNPKNKKELTFEEALGPAMEIQDEAEAKQYLKDYIKWRVGKAIKKSAKGKKGLEKRYWQNKGEELCKKDLAYYAGYYDDATRRRVEELFECQHPVFGSIKENGSPTPKEAFEMGKKWVIKSEENPQ